MLPAALSLAVSSCFYFVVTKATNMMNPAWILPLAPWGAEEHVHLLSSRCREVVGRQWRETCQRLLKTQ